MAYQVWQNITAKDLETLVWSLPTSTLSKALGVSDVAISKKCKKFCIKKPPRGFWARVYAGQLPHPNGDAVIKIRVRVPAGRQVV